MISISWDPRWLGALGLAAFCLGAADDRAVAPVDEVASGKIVWLADAVGDQYQLRVEDNARHHVLALKTDDGQILPVIEDARGGAFRVDQRIRDTPLQLTVRRYPGLAAVQVIQIRERREGRLFELDYWCDICAITMVSSGPCACCQQENELRRRPVP